MKSKSFALLSLSILTVLVLTAFASATIDVTGPTTSLSQSAGSFDITISGGNTQATATATLNSSNNINNIAITNGGKGYVSAPTVTISDGTTTDTATTTITAGVVTAITGYNPALVYATVPTVTIVAPTTSTSVTFTASEVKDSDGTAIVFTLPPSLTLPLNDGTDSVTVSYTTTDFDFKFGGKYSVTINATDSSNATNKDSTTLIFVQTPFYDGTHKSDLEISKSDLDFTTLTNAFGDDESYWYPLDNVEVNFNVDNIGSYDIENIKIEACLFDNSAKKCVMDEGDMEIDYKKFDLDSGDNQDVKMTFQVDPDKLKEGNTDYILYLKAVGKVNDDTSSYDGQETGISNSKEIEIVTNDNFVVLNNIQMSETASCGSNLQITADVWNVGNEKQKDAYIKIINKELGINQKVTLDDIKAMGNEQIDVTIALPSDANEKQYDLTFTIYDEDGKVYETSKDEDKKAEFSVPLTINSCSLVPKVSVAATLESDAKSGQELVIKVTIANSGSDKETLNLGLSGYADWASLVSIDKTAVSLNAGQTTDVLITLKVNNDISGDKKFDIVITEGDKILTQPIKVTIEKSSFQLPSSITGFFSGSSGNLYLWGIGALNVLLILIIVVVAIRVAKKK